MKKLLSLCFCLCSLALFGQTNPPGKVTLAWNPSPGTNVITNYTVYYGGASATYTSTVSAGLALTVTVSNLTRGATYYFAATARDTNNLESPFSNEVSATIPTPPPAPTLLRIISQ